jgi:hypothetical protein
MHETGNNGDEGMTGARWTAKKGEERRYRRDEGRGKSAQNKSKG